MTMLLSKDSNLFLILVIKSPASHMVMISGVGVYSDLMSVLLVKVTLKITFGKTVNF